jgi:hypothetical protein
MLHPESGRAVTLERLARHYRWKTKDPKPTPRDEGRQLPHGHGILCRR